MGIDIVAGIVSCDIVGHSGNDLTVQQQHIEGINGLVRALITSHREDIVWASGGDGGHVAFLCRDWQFFALQYICDLRSWAEEQHVALRIVGHCGSVLMSEGADGRCQLIGHGINLAGRLLTYGVSGGVAVSDDFKAAINERRIDGIVLHGERLVRPKYFPSQRLHLLSKQDRFSSTWNTMLKLERAYLIAGDRVLLSEVKSDKRRAWEVVYYAKRVMQVDINDHDAENALIEISSHTLVHRSDRENDSEGELIVNSFFEMLDPAARVEIIRLSQLVERKRNEVICECGSKGDSMFVVLKGDVGIFPNGVVGDSANFIEPPFRARPGESVGEIAFALRIARTATLLAATDVSLLSFDMDQVLKLTEQPAVGSDFATTLERYLRLRVLKFVCLRLPYLIGREQDGPLRRYKIEKILSYTARIECRWMAGVVSRNDARFKGRGVYILVRGKLQCEATGELLDCEEGMPIVFAALPELESNGNRRFSVMDDCVVLHIDLEQLLKHDPSTFRAVVAAISFGSYVSVSATRTNAGVTGALATWRERLAFFQNQEAIASDPAQKFNLQKQIEEARQRIGELEV